MKVRITNTAECHPGHGLQAGEVYDAQWVDDDGRCLQVTLPNGGNVIIDWPGCTSTCWELADNETRQLIEAMEAELHNELAMWLIAVRDQCEPLFGVIEYSTCYVLRHNPSGDEHILGDGVDMVFDENGDPISAGDERLCGMLEDMLNADVEETLEAYFPDHKHDEDAGWIDVRIQVYENGEYAFHSGDASYDQDHRGHWGCGCLSAASEDVALVDTARDMVEQVLDSVAQSE